jgi:hypothetical protein
MQKREGLEIYKFLSLKLHPPEPFVFGRKCTRDLPGFSNLVNLAAFEPKAR